MELTPVEKWLDALRERTSARILVGRSGGAYQTRDQLALRCDHAAALDAVHQEVQKELLDRLNLFEVSTQATSKQEHLLRPDLGRRLSDEAKETLTANCQRAAEVQVVVGDGLSATAIHAQVPHLLPMLEKQVKARGLSFGRPFFIRYCRVGALNDIGEALDPSVVVLLVGERPGLATAESLSAYLAYRPRIGDTDAKRNLISNIHDQGVGCEEAVERILALVEMMRRERCSGVEIKETRSIEPG